MIRIELVGLPLRNNVLASDARRVTVGSGRDIRVLLMALDASMLRAYQSPYSIAD